MSATDKRVVEFDFDNRKFEKGVKKSIISLNNLKKACDFSEMGQTIETVSAKAVAKVELVKRWVNRLADSAERLVKSLSIDNVTDGWSKFEQKTKAVATMAAQNIRLAGKTIEDYAEKMTTINTQLEKLNWFTDQTSYNFTDMADNIGKFTAAGQDLDKSVNAMMGIANWAALSGQNATMASRAMYNLAQSMGKGYVQLIDYKSIQNANMDTEEFREKVLETAVAMKELTVQGDQYITKTGAKFKKAQFAEELNAKWFTGDVLVKTLEQYSGAVQRIYEISTETGLTAAQVMARYSDQLDEFGLKAFKSAQEARTFTDAINATKDAVSSSWLNTFEKIIGSYDESKVFWSDMADLMYDVFAASGEFRNSVLKTWNTLEGRADLFEHGSENQGAFWNILDAMTEIKEMVKSSWNNIFPISELEEYGERADDVARKLKNLTEALKEQTKKIKDAIVSNGALIGIFNGLFAILKNVSTTVKGVRYALDPLIDTLKEGGSALLQMLGRLGNNIASSTRYTEFIYDKAEKINEVLTNLLSNVDLPKFMENISRALTSLGRNVKTVFDVMKNKFDELTNGGEEIREAWTKILDYFNGAMQKLSNAFDNFDDKKAQEILTHIGEGLAYVGKYASKVITIIPQIGSTISGLFKGEITMTDVVTRISNSLGQLIDKIKEFFTSIKGNSKVSDAISKLGIDKESISVASDISSIITNLVDIFKGIVHALKLFTDLLKSALGLIHNVTIVLTQVIDNVSAAVKKLSEMPAEEIKENLKKMLIIAGCAAVAVVVAKIIYNLVYSVNDVASGFVNLSDSISKFLRQSGKSKVMNAFAALIQSLGQSLILVAASFAILSRLDTKAISTGSSVLLEVAVLATAMAFVVQKTNKSFADLASQMIKLNKTERNINNINSVSPLTSMAGIITGMGVAMLELAVAFKMMSEVKQEDVDKGKETLWALALATTLLVSITAVVGRGGNVTKKAYPGLLTMIGFANIIKTYAKTIITLSDVDWKKAWPGVAALGGLFVLLIGICAAVAAGARGDQSKQLSKSIRNLSLFASSMVSVAGSIKWIGSMKWEDLGKAATMLGGFLFILSTIVLPMASATGEGANTGYKSILALAALNGSLVYFAVSAKILGTMEWGEIGKAAAIMGGAFIAYGTFLILAGTAARIAKQNNVYSSILALAALNTSIVAFALGMKILASIDTVGSGFVPTLIGLGVLIAEFGLLVMAMSCVSKGTGSIKANIAAMVSLIGGIAILCAAVAALSFLDPTRLIVPIIGVTAMMTAMGWMLHAIVKIGNSAKIAPILAALLPMIGIIVAMTAALTMLQDVDNSKIQNFAGGVALIISTMALAFAVISNFSASAGTIISFAGAMAVMSGALWMFAVAGQQLKDVDFKALASGLALFAAGIAIMIIAGKFIEPIVKSLLLFSGAIVVVGFGLYMVSSAMESMAGSITAFAQNAVEALDNLLLIFNAFITNILEFITSNTELIASSISSIIQAICMAIDDSIIAITNTIKTVLDSVLSVIKAVLPDLLEIAGMLINGILNFIFTNAPIWAEGLFSAVSKILDVLLTYAPSIAYKLGQLLVDVVMAGMDVIIDNSGKLLNKAFDMLLTFTRDLGITLKNRAFEAGATFIEFGRNLISSLWNGIVGGLSEMFRGMPIVGDKICEWLENSLQINSPSKRTAEMGRYLDEGLVVGMEDNADKTARGAAASLGTVVSAINDALTDVNGDNSMTFTPVLDLSEVQSGARDLSNIMTGISAGSTSVTANFANGASSAVSQTRALNSSQNQNGVVTNNNSTDNYYNTFNISGSDDPEEVARQVDVQLQRNRKQSALAKGGLAFSR